MVRLNRLAWLALLGWPRIAGAQTAPDMATILERLDRIERENTTLTEKVKALEDQLAALRSASGTVPALSLIHI